MPLDQSSQGPRPRRLSFTQHLHRMFNVDLSLNQQKQRNAHSPEDERSMYIPTNLQDNANRDPVHLTDKDPKGVLCQPPSSVTIESNNIESRPMSSSEQPAPRTLSLQIATTSTTKQSPERPQICVSPTWHKGMTQKSDRRATRRLEKERLELEARLLRLEQTAEVEDHTRPRNNTRRLVKKQPLGSSSRASSVDAEEPRASRFSAVFSRHSSRSRSRSSSLTGDKHASRHRSHNRIDVLGSDQLSQEATPVLPITLPERFGTAVSKDLAVRTNVLLPPYIYPDFSAIDVDGSLSTVDVVDNSVTAQEIYTRGRRIHDKKGIVFDQMQNADHQSTSTELDRMSFTASLKPNKRNGDVRQNDEIPPPQPQKTINQETNKPSTANTITSPLKLSSDHENGRHVSNAPNQGNSTIVRPELSNNQNFGRGIPRRSHKRFASSPLAASPTLNPDIDMTTGANTASETRHGKDSAGFSNGRGKLAGSRQRTPHSHTGPQFSIENPRLGKRSWGFSKRHRLTADFTKADPPLDQNNAIYREAPSNTGPCLPASQPVAIRDVGKGIQSQLKDKDLPCLSSLPTGLPKLQLTRTGTAKDGCSESVPGNSKIIDQDQSLSPERSSRQPTRNNGKGPSNISLSRSSSQDSVEYDTADETPSGVLQQKSGGDPLTDSHLNCSSNGDPTATIPKAANARPRRFFESQRRTQQDQVVAKLFVICCTCKFWHDMPSEVYAKLAFPPRTAVVSADQTVSISSEPPKHSPRSLLTQIGGQKEQSTVRCCWCDHHMSKSCCQGWTTIVHLRERHH